MTRKSAIGELTKEEWDQLCEIVKFPEKKEEFTEQFRDLIVEWLKAREQKILDLILGVNQSAIWKRKSYGEVMSERNELENKIRKSRNRNNSGIDKNMAQEILSWGHASLKPLSYIGDDEFIQLTKRVFELVEQNKYFKATYILMKRLYKSCGIAGTTKLLGLSNQNKLCVYDSRVGHYLSDLKRNCTKLVLHPPGRKHCPKSDDTTQRSWAKSYERLIWTLEIAQDYLVERTRQIKRPIKLRIGDIELAFFALGNCSDTSSFV